MHESDSTPYGDFSGKRATGYDDRIEWIVPGYEMMHHLVANRMHRLCADRGTRILVVGAGTGTEILRAAERLPRATFLGVEPSDDMRQIASEKLSDFLGRVELVSRLEPGQEYDFATLLLTLHFLPYSQKVSLLAKIKQGLKPGATLALVDFSPEKSDFLAQIEDWEHRQISDETSQRSQEIIAQSRSFLTWDVPWLEPAAELELLREVGFSQAEPFWQGLGFRGWFLRQN